MDLKQFATLMHQRSRMIIVSANELKKLYVTNLLTSYALTTPIDTGLAVSNYQVTMVDPADEYLPAHFPGNKRSTADANIRATIAAAQFAINNVQPGIPLHLINHVEYVVDLDRGTSTQAPSGMTPTAFLTARRALATFKMLP